jgi:hypothetical protein
MREEEVGVACGTRGRYSNRIIVETWRKETAWGAWALVGDNIKMDF